MSAAAAGQGAAAGARWRILLLTCRDPRSDFRLPLARELQALGHEVTYAYLKRRPVVVDMATPDASRTFSLPGFLAFARTLRGRRPLLVFNSTNLVFPGLSRLLRALCGGLWCLDMHDDLLYDRAGLARARGVVAQRLLLQGSDFVVHAAPTLRELFPASRHLGNASAVTRIARPERRYDRLLVLASLDRRFAFDFLARAASTNPALFFDIHGQVSRSDPAVAADLGALLRDNPNVAHHGPYVNEDLPRILGAYSATLAPYATGSRLTRYIDPLRYYHCLNSGMEVISTDIPKARDFGDIVHVVTEAAELGPLVARLRDDPAARRNDGGRWRGEDWAGKAARLMEIAASQAAASKRRELA